MTNVYYSNNPLTLQKSMKGASWAVVFILIVVIVVLSVILSLVNSRVDAYVAEAERTAQAVEVATSNTVYCDAEPSKCVVVLNNNIQIPSPLISEYNPTLTLLAVDLVARVGYAFDGGRITSPNGLIQRQIYRSTTNDLIGISWSNLTNDSLYIAFRGTSTASEILNDLQYGQTTFIPNTDLKCHSGFVAEYRAFRNQMVAWVASYPPNVQIFICGHSLGAALATLATSDLGTSTSGLGRPVYTYALASPRVCNQPIDGFSAFWRVQNSLDIVPSLAWSVSPNIVNPSSPFFYTSTGPVREFTEQRLSLSNNHSLAAIQQNASAN